MCQLCTVMHMLQGHLKVMTSMTILAKEKRLEYDLGYVISDMIIKGTYNPPEKLATGMPSTSNHSQLSGCV